MATSPQIPRIPRVRSGTPVKASQFNALAEAVESLVTRAAIKEKAFAVDSKRPFQGWGLNQTGGTGTDWTVNVAPGFLFSVHVENMETSSGVPSASAVQMFTPTILVDAANVSITTTPAPVLGLPAIVSWVYLKFSTTERGSVNFNPTTDKVEIVALETEAEAYSQHDLQEDENDSGAVEGEYFIQIFKTISNGLSGANEAPLLVNEGHQSNFTLGHEQSLANRGNGEYIYVSEDPDIDSLLLRSIVGHYGTEATTSGNEIHLKFEGDTVASTDGSFEDVYYDPGSYSAGDKAEFHGVGEGESSGRQQIEVVMSSGGEEAGYIQVMGNAIDGSLTVSKDGAAATTLIEWEDGLITTAGEATFNTYTDT